MHKLYAVQKYNSRGAETLFSIFYFFDYDVFLIDPETEAHSRHQSMPWMLVGRKDIQHDRTEGVHICVVRLRASSGLIPLT